MHEHICIYNDPMVNLHVQTNASIFMSRPASHCHYALYSMCYTVRATFHDLMLEICRIESKLATKYILATFNSPIAPTCKYHCVTTLLYRFVVV